MKKRIEIFLPCVLLLLGILSSPAQGFASLAKSSPGFAAMLSKYCGNATEFSANLDAEHRMPGRPPRIMPCKMVFSNGKLRQDVDVTQLPLSPGLANAMHEAGISRMVFLVRSDKKMVHLLFPDLQVYMQVPITDADLQRIATMSAASNLEKTPLSDDVLDGHPCAKAQVVSSAFTNDTATIWYAKDLKDFPIEIEAPALLLHFKNVNLEKPDPALFDVPADYILENNSQAVVDLAIKRLKDGNINKATSQGTP
jgi:hypothetical protein